MRNRALLRAIAACISIGLTLLTRAPASAAMPRTATSPQGVFEDCAPGDGIERCVARLQDIARGGFGIVIDYSQFYGSAAEQLAYARAATRAGVRIIWNFSEPAFYDGTPLVGHFPALARTCACRSNAAFLAYTVRLVRGLPCTWGYFVGDEPPVRDRAAVSRLSGIIRALDPRHPRLLVAVGDPDPGVAASAIAPFAGDAEYLAADYYPVGAHEPIDAVRQAAYNVATTARRSDARSAFVLQAFDWAEYPGQTPVCTPLPRCARFPTLDEMRAMRKAAEAGAHAALLLWYSYFDVARSDDPRRNWLDLQRAAAAPP